MTVGKAGRSNYAAPQHGLLISIACSRFFDHEIGDQPDGL
jgi:hypothetical protein